MEMAASLGDERLDPRMTRVQVYRPAGQRLRGVVHGVVLYTTGPYTVHTLEPLVHHQRSQSLAPRHATIDKWLQLRSMKACAPV